MAKLHLFLMRIPWAFCHCGPKSFMKGSMFHRHCMRKWPAHSYLQLWSSPVPSGPLELAHEFLCLLLLCFQWRTWFFLPTPSQHPFSLDTTVPAEKNEEKDFREIHTCHLCSFLTSSNKFYLIITYLNSINERGVLLLGYHPLLPSKHPVPKLETMPATL